MERLERRVGESERPLETSEQPIIQKAKDFEQSKYTWPSFITRHYLGSFFELRREVLPKHFACFGAVFRSFAVRPLYLAKQLLVAGGISGVILSLLRLSHLFPGGDRQLQKQGLLWGFGYLNIFPFYQGFSSSSSILWHSSNFL
ncbi:Uncharacterized protein Fot_20496 [Forsythia ovata]|uniref:Uncharacterized protein n=1 Tax=Forsythia ovata TaxID=205694 RepID=A0ABD1US63_9LAMI